MSCCVHDDVTDAAGAVEGRGDAHGPRRARRRRHRAVAVCPGAVRCCVGARRAGTAGRHDRGQRRGRGSASRPTSVSSSARSKGCPTQRQNAPCCRFRRTKSIPTAGWRLTCASRLRAHVRSMPPHPDAGAWSLRPQPRCCRGLVRPASCSARRCDLQPGLDLSPGDLADLSSMAGFTREDPVDEHGEFCRPRRHPRRLPCRITRAVPDRVHRRHDRVDPPLRSVHTAVHRTRRAARYRPACATSFGEPTKRAPGATAVFDYFSRARQPL